MAKQQDNNTYRQKVILRQMGLRYVPDPVVMETHGGTGKLYDACYRPILQGVVFEKEPDRALVLAQQRPTWAVYEADCLQALRGGVGGHLTVNWLDVDPYGDPWPAVMAFFESDRPWADVLGVVVHDGIRQKLRISGGWDIPHFQDAVHRFGNDLHEMYLEVCRSMMTEIAAQAGYSLSRWAGFYSGQAKRATHWLAILTR